MGEVDLGVTDYLVQIKTETEKLNLVAIGYCLQGSVRIGSISPEYYGECMVALSRKLGFGITDASLAAALESLQ